MLSKKVKDIKIRQIFASNELSILRQKFLFTNLMSTNRVKKKKKVLLSFLNKKDICGSKVKIVRRCSLTNRARGNVRLAGVSRIVLKELVNDRVLPGFTKYSW
jgi:small subunit ribosomal protein S14